MRGIDIIAFAYRALSGYPTRTLLMLLAMAVGVGSVVLLTGLGEGARRYITDEFSALGTNLLIVMPGRNETAGGAPPIVGETPRDLTLADAEALHRSPAIASVAPINVGQSTVTHGALGRETVVMGTTASFAEVRNVDLYQGRFLPEQEYQRADPVAVIGTVIRDELFSGERALGQWIRLGDRRFRVVGVMSQRGQSMTMDMDELVIIPVGAAQALFNTSSLFRIFVAARDRPSIPTAQADILRIIAERHDGEEDVTVITQDSMLAAFDRILQALTMTVGGIGAISLMVAGVLIMNVMLVAVSQRTAEIGLLRALGASGRRVLVLFLGEAALLSAFGAVAGLLAGLLGTWLIHLSFPVLPALPPLWAVVVASAIALATGVLFAWLPARRAAALDPVTALSRR
ncbi:ABC transporter permease [Ectothiorhodospiraceae bacterium WFHF3C12]|nr:ABC transporter permease [Ectothiorhodospiraceae bacterium WFHF3C12]